MGFYHEACDMWWFLFSKPQLQESCDYVRISAFIEQNSEFLALVNVEGRLEGRFLQSLTPQSKEEELSVFYF